MSCGLFWNLAVLFVFSSLKLTNLFQNVFFFFEKQALIDGPCTNVCRKALNFKYLSLTDFTVKIRPSAKSGPVREAFQKGEIQEKWEQTSWAKRLAAKKKRATLNDFDRFKLKLAKQKKNEIIQEELRKLRKEANLWLLSILNKFSVSKNTWSVCCLDIRSCRM